MQPYGDLQLVVIGHARTPWRKGDCPKSMRAARETGRPAEIVVAPEFRAGLVGLERASHLVLLGWFHAADRASLLLQPTHLAVEQGCFALRSPARPNPIGLSIVRRIDLDLAGGMISLEALDWFDGTPLLDIKPYYPSNDLHPDAVVLEPPSS
jgi:tRNA (adenine37-N6)-methyltransferase